MSRTRSGNRTGRPLPFSLALAFAIAACSAEPSGPAGEKPAALSAARQTAATDMTVTSAAPDSATQDTTLEVTVNGSGFVPGTTATWGLDGVEDPLQVRTNGTQYVSPRQLVVNITISATATVGAWDIIVAASGKKGGIGTETFAIKQKPNADYNSRANYVIEHAVNVNPPGAPVDMQPTGLRGDGRLRDGTPANGSPSEYQGGFCGANGIIFNGFTGNQSDDSGDLNFAPDGLHGGYCGDARFYNFHFAGTGSAPTRAAAATRLSGVWWTDVGVAVFKPAAFHVHLTDCTQLVYDDAFAPSRSLRVTRLPDVPSVNGPRRQWRLESQGTHMATCRIQKSLKRYVTGASYYMPISILVTEVPYPFATYP